MHANIFLIIVHFFGSLPVVMSPRRVVKNNSAFSASHGRNKSKSRLTPSESMIPIDEQKIDRAIPGSRRFLGSLPDDLTPSFEAIRTKTTPQESLAIARCTHIRPWILCMWVNRVDLARTVVAAGKREAQVLFPRAPPDFDDHSGYVRSGQSVEYMDSSTEARFPVGADVVRPIKEISVSPEVFRSQPHDAKYNLSQHTTVHFRNHCSTRLLDTKRWHWRRLGFRSE